MSSTEYSDELIIKARQRMEEADQQLDLFTDYEAEAKKKAREDAELAREKKQQQVILGITKKFGKNAILKGMSLQDGATTADRNKQIGGHKA